MTLRRRLSLVLLALILAGLILPWRPALAHSEIQSAAAAGDCTNQLGIGTVNWTNPGNAFSDNGVYATRSVDGTISRWIQCLNYGFAIPAGATILGIEVNVERRSSSIANGGSRDAGMRLVKAGVIEPVANDRSTATVYPIADTVGPHGSPTDLWGTTWSVAEINAANFGAAFAVTKPNAAGGAHTVSVDHIQIVVYYSQPPDTPNLLSPADGATVTTATPTFDWSDATDPDGDTFSYEVQADNSGCGFASPEVNQTGVAASTFTPGAALADGTYCWRARAVDSHTIPGPWSTTRNVTINTVNAFDAVAVTAAMNTAITTKIAGSTFSLDVLALKAAAVHAGYRGTVTVEIVDAATGGGVCAAMTQLQNLGSFTFVAGDNGRKTVSTFSFANAAANARIRIIDTSVSITSCSFDNFAIRPNALANLSVTDDDPQTPGTTRTLNSTTIGAIFHKAGRNFTVRADAHNTSSVITGAYTGSVTAVAEDCGSGVGFEACADSQGTVSIASSFAAGVLNSNATYSEVGSFNLRLEDRTFAAVDALDTPGDCTAAGRFVCSSTIAVGRFVPDHLTLTASGASGPSLTNRNDVLACADAATTGTVGAGSTALTAGSSAGFATGDTIVVVGAGPGGIDLVTTVTVAGTSFTLGAATSVAVTNTPVRKINYSYMGEPMKVVFTLTAENASNGTTSNYAGALARLDPATPALFGFSALNGTTDLTTRTSATLTGAWLAGTATFTSDVTVSRAGAGPDGPLNTVRIGIAPADSDGVQLLAAAYNLDVNNDAANDRASIGTTRLRFGRLAMRNASGSQLVPLQIPLETQYWNGTVFVTNVDDSCTRLDGKNVQMSNYQGIAPAPNCNTRLPSTPVTFDAIAFSNGRALALLTPPTGGLAGSVDLTPRLEQTPGGSPETCISTGVPTTVNGKNATYFQGNWGGGGYTDNPTARATFGVYRGSEEVIFIRENF